jgi:hypothetical protein
MFKWITIEDIGRDLNPIGFGLKSPILKPSRFSIETIGQLLSITGVTKMSEVFEQDHTLRVPLTKQNFRTPFEEIWAELNPDMEFPYSRNLVDLSDKPPVVDPLTTQSTGLSTGDGTGQNAELTEAEQQQLLLEANKSAEGGTGNAEQNAAETGEKKSDVIVTDENAETSQQTNTEKSDPASLTETDTEKTADPKPSEETSADKQSDASAPGQNTSSEEASAAEQPADSAQNPTDATSDNTSASTQQVKKHNTNGRKS